MGIVVYYTWRFFYNQARKTKEIRLEKISHTIGKWNFLTLMLIKFLYFLKRKLFLYFGNGNPERKFLYFRKGNFLIFLETKTLKNFLYFRKRNLLNSKNKKFLIFWEMELSSHKIRNFPIFQEGI